MKLKRSIKTVPEILQIGGDCHKISTHTHTETVQFRSKRLHLFNTGITSNQIPIFPCLCHNILNKQSSTQYA